MKLLADDLGPRLRRDNAVVDGNAVTGKVTERPAENVARWTAHLEERGIVGKMRSIAGAVFAALACAACGGAAIPAEPRPAAVAETAPKTAPAPIVAAIAAPDPWNVELVATGDVLRNVALTVGSEGTFIVYSAPAVGRIERVRRGTARWWSPEPIVDGGSARVTFDRRTGGPSWALLGDEPGVGARFPNVPHSTWAQRLAEGSPPEKVLDGAVRAYAIALGPGGTPHACVSTSTHSALSYASRGKQGWSTTTIGKESERCAIAAGDDGTVVVASANIAAVDVAVRSRAGIWKSSALEAGERFAAVDVATRGNDTVVVFSNAQQVKLARLRGDGTWTQTVLVPDAGGIVGAIALALDSAGRAQIACSVRRDKESSDEVVLVSEVTGTSSRVALDDSWRFTSLSLVLDGGDRPHVAYTGAAGRLFYATQVR